MKNLKIKEAFYEMHLSESLFKVEVYFPMHYKVKGQCNEKFNIGYTISYKGAN